MNSLWALVPLKDLAKAKTRLSGALPPQFRRALALAMASDVAAALAKARSIERVVFVSDIPDLPRLIGVPEVSSLFTNASGLNEDLSAASLWATNQGASHVLIAHADLPFLTPTAIDQFVAPLGAEESWTGVRVAACKHGTGTNLLLSALPLALPLVFGRDSLAQFRNSAARAAITFDVRFDPALAADIDDLSDFEALDDLWTGGELRDCATAALLRDDRARRRRTGKQLHFMGARC